MMDSPAVQKWRGKVAPSSYKAYLGRFKAWYSWMQENGGPFKGMSPDELVEYQRSINNGTIYDILDLLQNWVNGQNIRWNSKKSCYAAVRSFFLHNRVPLPRDPAFNIRSDVPRVVGSLTTEEIRDVVLSCNKTYQAIFLSMFQGALDESCYEYWNLNGWVSLREQLREDPDIVRIDLPGRKSKRNKEPFYTHIGGDAIKAIRNYLPHRPKGGTAIFYDKNGDPLSKTAVWQYWLRHLKELGIIVKGDKGTANRYGKNPHEMRDVFRSLWEKSPAKYSVAEYLMGHQVDPLEYNKAFRDEKWTQREYRKALPFLNILSSARPFGQVDEDIVESQVRRIEELEVEISHLKSNVDYKALRAEVEELISFKRQLDEFMTTFTSGQRPGEESLLSAESIRQVLIQAERYAKEEAGMSELEIRLARKRRERELDNRLEELEREGRVKTLEEKT